MLNNTEVELFNLPILENFKSEYRRYLDEFEHFIRNFLQPLEFFVHLAHKNLRPSARQVYSKNFEIKLQSWFKRFLFRALVINLRYGFPIDMFFSEKFCHFIDGQIIDNKASLTYEILNQMLLLSRYYNMILYSRKYHLCFDVDSFFKREAEIIDTRK